MLVLKTCAVSPQAQEMDNEFNAITVTELHSLTNCSQRNHAVL